MSVNATPGVTPIQGMSRMAMTNASGGVTPIGGRAGGKAPALLPIEEESFMMECSSWTVEPPGRSEKNSLDQDEDITPASKGGASRGRLRMPNAH